MGGGGDKLTLHLLQLPFESDITQGHNSATHRVFGSAQQRKSGLITAGTNSSGFAQATIEGLPRFIALHCSFPPRRQLVVGKELQ